MKIVNAMFGRGLGGIEQSFVDYARQLKKEGCTVINLVRPEAQIIDSLWPVSSRIYKIKNLGWWDYLSVLKIKKILRDFKPDAIITHGSRANSLLSKANSQHAPIITLTHNYKLKKMLKSDAFFAITDHLRQSVANMGVAPGKIFHIPNMIEAENIKFSFNKWENRKPVIGAMGRFVSKKGFDDYLTALAILKDKKVPFTAVLAGDGEEAENLKSLAKRLGLEKDITFTGWANDKKAFFESIDIFCLPSLHEPFGIVLIEAMAYGKPVATSDSEGPSEIIRDEENGLVFPRRSPEAMAAALKKIIDTPRLTEWIADHAYKTVRLEYSADVVGKKISSALAEITSRRRHG